MSLSSENFFSCKVLVICWFPESLRRIYKAFLEVCVDEKEVT